MTRGAKQLGEETEISSTVIMIRDEFIIETT